MEGFPLAILAAGLWPALPVTGWLVLHGSRASLRHAAAGVAFAVASAVGLALWAPILLLFLVSGSWSATTIGTMGWLTTGGALVWWASLRQARSSRSSDRGEAFRLDFWDIVLVSGLLLTAFLYLGFPGEFIIGGRDENSYALHGLWIAQHGRLDIPYPWPAELHETFYDAFIRFSGTFRTEPTMTPAFGHVLPVLFAQAASGFGDAGLFRLSGAFALLSAAVFYGVLRLGLPKSFAVLGTLFLALNPGQIWIARTTLTEILTQLLIWTALYLLIGGLRDGNTPRARWAGIVLGAAVLVRIDVLVVVGPLVIAHLGTRAVEGQRYGSSAIWRGLYEALIPSVALASAYFVIFSRPYVIELRPQLTQVLALTLAAVVAFAMGSRRMVWPLLNRLATSQAFLVLLGVVLAALTVYAYFIRPTQEPFEIYEATRLLLGGKRTYAEDALPNLATYLSTPVVLGGIGGWLVAYWLAARSRVGHWMPLLLVGGGFTALYVANPSVTPDHFWAVRRFVPVVFPALIAFAMFAMMHLIKPLPRSASTVLCLAALGGFGLFSVQTFRPFVFLTEHNGYRSQLQALAEQLPTDEIVLAMEGERWWKPLYTIFDRQVIPISLRTEVGRDAFVGWISVELEAGRQPVVVGVGELLDVPGLAIARVGEQTLSRRQHRGTATPPPTERAKTDTLVGVFRIDGEDPTFTFRDVNLVYDLVWGAQRSGFHDREQRQGEAVAWTDGAGRIVLPIRGDMPRVLHLSIQGIPEREVGFRLLVSGEELRAGSVSADGWTEDIDLSGVQTTDVLVIEILSDEVSEDQEVLIDGSLYRTQVGHRKIGVPVRDLVLRDG